MILHRFHRLIPLAHPFECCCCYSMPSRTTTCLSRQVFLNKISTTCTHSNRIEVESERTSRVESSGCSHNFVRRSQFQPPLILMPNNNAESGLMYEINDGHFHPLVFAPFFPSIFHSVCAKYLHFGFEPISAIGLYVRGVFVIYIHTNVHVDDMCVHMGGKRYMYLSCLPIVFVACSHLTVQSMSMCVFLSA